MTYSRESWHVRLMAHKLIKSVCSRHVLVCYISCSVRSKDQCHMTEIHLNSCCVRRYQNACNNASRGCLFKMFNIRFGNKSEFDNNKYGNVSWMVDVSWFNNERVAHFAPYFIFILLNERIKNSYFWWKKFNICQQQLLLIIIINTKCFIDMII